MMCVLQQPCGFGADMPGVEADLRFARCDCVSQSSLNAVSAHLNAVSVARGDAHTDSEDDTLLLCSQIVVGASQYQSVTDARCLTSQLAPPSVEEVEPPRAIQGLEDVIALLGLQIWTHAILQWCAEMGAAFLDEVADCAELIADNVDLLDDERERFLRWAIEFRAESVSEASGDEDPVANQDGTDTFNQASCGRVRWAPLLTEYVYIDIDFDERDIPLLEICPSGIEHRPDHDCVGDGKGHCSQKSSEYTREEQPTKNHLENDVNSSKNVRCDETQHNRTAKRDSLDNYGQVAILLHVVDDGFDWDTDADSDWEDVCEVDHSDDDMQVPTTSVVGIDFSKQTSHMYAVKSLLTFTFVQDASVRLADTS